MDLNVIMKLKNVLLTKMVKLSASVPAVLEKTESQYVG